MTSIQKGLYSLVGLGFTTVSTVAAFSTQPITLTDISKDPADVAIQNLLTKAMVYLSLLAVLYGIWGGFQIVTAGGDEEKVKKGRTILIQVALGIIVIWLAGSIVRWVVGLVA